MSILSVLFGWTKAPQWVLEIAVFSLLLVVAMYTHHVIFTSGINHQKAIDAAALIKLRETVATETVALQLKANQAEIASNVEIQALRDYRNAHPLGPVRLCHANDSSPGMSQTGAANPKHADASPPPAGLQPVPGGNSGPGPWNQDVDISGLLSAIAARADALSDQLREFQARE